jgi:hypothetical protein
MHQNRMQMLRKVNEMIIEMECLICGDHDNCDDDIRVVLCNGCGNGVMVPCSEV